MNLKVLIVSCNIQFDYEGKPIPGTGLSGMQMVAPILSGFIFRVDSFPFFAGQLPKELGKLVNLKVFNARSNMLRGGLSTRSERFNFATEIDVAFYAGPLPNVLPISLEVFNLGGYSNNTNKFTGGIPSEWGALTNLKELSMVACGLGGKPLRTRPTTWSSHLTRRAFAQVRTQRRRPLRRNFPIATFTSEARADKVVGLVLLFYHLSPQK